MAGKSISDNGIRVVFNEVRVGLSCQASNAYFVYKKNISKMNVLAEIMNVFECQMSFNIFMQRTKESCMQLHSYK